jgi:sulfatase modifying factor 1
MYFLPTLKDKKNISISGFFMDDTEITNNEYRQFVEWVRDSTAHEIMGNKSEDDLAMKELTGKQNWTTVMRH